MSQERNAVLGAATFEHSIDGPCCCFVSRASRFLHAGSIFPQEKDRRRLHYSNQMRENGQMLITVVLIQTLECDGV